jgi:chromosome segregation ATPase
MPNATDIDRIGALVTQLTPLGNVQRGELIKADDWNTLVNSVISIAQIVLSNEQNLVVPPHEHLEQVSLAWLTPSLRAQIQQGTLSDPASVATVNGLGRQISDLSGRIDKVNAQVSDAMGRLSGLSTTVAQRTADVTHVQQTVQGLTDARQEIMDVRATLSSLQQNVQTAVQASALLTVNGQPVNLGDIEQRLAGVEALKANLTNADGTLLSATDLDNRLQILQTSSVTQDQLTTALQNVQPILSPDQMDAITQQVETGIRNDMQTLATQLTNDVTNKTTALLAGINDTVAKGIADALPGVQNSILGVIRPEIASDIQASADRTTTAFQSKLDAATTSLQASIANETANIDSALPGQITAAINAQVAPTLATLNTNLTNVTNRVTAVETRIATHETNIANLGVQLSQVSQTDAAGRAQLQQSLNAQQQSTTTNLQNLSSQIAAQAQTDNAAINAAVASAKTDILSEAQANATTIANSATAAIATTLRGEMHQVAQDQVAGIQKQVTSIAATVAKHDAEIRQLQGRIKQAPASPEAKG